MHPRAASSFFNSRPSSTNSASRSSSTQLHRRRPRDRASTTPAIAARVPARVRHRTTPIGGYSDYLHSRMSASSAVHASRNEPETFWPRACSAASSPASPSPPWRSPPPRAPMGSPPRMLPRARWPCIPAPHLRMSGCPLKTRIVVPPDESGPPPRSSPLRSRTAWERVRGFGRIFRLVSLSTPRGSVVVRSARISDALPLTIAATVPPAVFAQSPSGMSSPRPHRIQNNGRAFRRPLLPP